MLIFKFFKAEMMCLFIGGRYSEWIVWDSFERGITLMNILIITLIFHRHTR